MNTNKLIKIEELPADIQEELRRRYEIQERLEQYKKEMQQSKSQPTVNIYNNNTYYINILRNDGTINEKEEGLLDIFARTAGKIAGKTYAELRHMND